MGEGGEVECWGSGTREEEVEDCTVRFMEGFGGWERHGGRGVVW